MTDKILIINDEEQVRELVSLVLNKKKYATCEAQNGQEGIEKAIREKPDLILLDIMMPGLNGFEVCKKLKSQPETKDIPVIFLSSLTDPKDKIKGLELGGVDFITRTGDQGELLARVQTHLKIKHLTQDLKTSNQLLIDKQNILNEDLKAAAEIQRSLLPSKNLKLPNFNIAWSCLPCDMIGGDIFNFIQINNEEFIFYILDVSGHGVPSAMVTASVSQHLNQQIVSKKHCLSPLVMMESLNQEYPFERFNKFFTIFYMHINIKNKKISYCNAGHPPAVLLTSKNPLKFLTCGGTIIGLGHNSPYEIGEIPANKGDKIILYTDGVTDYRNQNNEQYGSDRFYTFLDSIENDSVEAINSRIVQSLNDFGKTTPSCDDVSLLCIEIKSLDVFLQG